MFSSQSLTNHFQPAVVVPGLGSVHFACRRITLDNEGAHGGVSHRCRALESSASIRRRLMASSYPRCTKVGGGFTQMYLKICKNQPIRRGDGQAFLE